MVNCPLLSDLSEQSIKAWLLALYNQDALWHFDSHPNSVSWTANKWSGVEYFGDSYSYLVESYDAIMEHCDYYEIDIFSLYPVIK